jgi:NAD(P)-dependent dehydrogenase (short-subunit alcohol dehydrogenase family)
VSIYTYEAKPQSLHDRVILITGAAGGLGSALALAAARLGAELILLDKSQRGLNALHDKIEGESLTPPGLYPLDLQGASVDDYADMAAIVEKEFGALHGLVHCATTLGQLAPIEQTNMQEWAKTFQVNLHGPLMLTQAMLPLLRTQDRSTIIFTGDSRDKAYWGAYGASKAALRGVSNIIAAEVASTDDNPSALTCNMIDPGPMRTSLRASAFPGENPNHSPAPESRVPAYLYLLCQDGGTMNGEHLGPPKDA